MRPPAGLGVPLAALLAALLATAPARAQDAGAPPPADPIEEIEVPPPPPDPPAIQLPETPPEGLYHPEDEPDDEPEPEPEPEGDFGERDLDAEAEADVFDDPSAPTIAEVEAAMVPTLTLPEFRLRIGGGVSLPTSGGTYPLVRLTQDAEWMPPATEFLSFGIGAGQTTDFQSTTFVQVGARVGGFAWFCEEGEVRCMGAITLQIGAIFGAAVAFDLSADAALRLLIDESVEIGVRGGFFSVSTSSWLNITAEIAAAF